MIKDLGLVHENVEPPWSVSEAVYRLFIRERTGTHEAHSTLDTVIGTGQA